MTDFFAEHYFLAILATVAATMALMFVPIMLLLFSSELRRPRATSIVWLGITACLIGLAVPGFRGASLADKREDQAIRAEVLAKYDVAIQEWGDYRGRHGIELASLWKINGENVSCTVVAMDKPTDEVLFVCGGAELPRRAA